MKLVVMFLSFLVLCFSVSENTVQAQEMADEYAQRLAQAKPEDVLAFYLESLENRDVRPHLSIYTKETREWLETWPVNDTQMENEARDLRNCGLSDTRSNETHAVVRFHPEKQRQCAPYFFKWEDGSWRLDLFTMTKVIQFNHKNEWHLKKQEGHPYVFAFKDYVLDKNGFPFERK